MRAARRATVSCRAAATATPSAATSRSAASAQAASMRPAARPSSRTRLRLRSARSSAVTRVPCSLSTVSTMRSRKRRRSDAPPVKSPSMAGVSHTTRRWSAKLLAEVTGARSMRHFRPAGAAPSPTSKPVPSCTSGTTSPPSSSSSETAQLPAPPSRAQSASSARRRPRPGVKNDRASSRFVLPAPLCPASTTGAPDSGKSSVA